MTNREFIDKNGNSWTWEETPETVEALKKLHGDVEQANSKLIKKPQLPNV
jgi:hypothetical protein